MVIPRPAHAVPSYLRTPSLDYLDINTCQGDWATSCRHHGLPPKVSDAMIYATCATTIDSVVRDLATFAEPHSGNISKRSP